MISPNPMGILNQKNLWPTLIYQFEQLGHPNDARLFIEIYINSVSTNKWNNLRKFRHIYVQLLNKNESFFGLNDENSSQSHEQQP